MYWIDSVLCRGGPIESPKKAASSSQEGNEDENVLPTAVVSHNLIATGDDQVAAIRVVTADTVRGIVVEGNVLTGENRKILVEGDLPDRVQVRGNAGVKEGK